MGGCQPDSTDRRRPRLRQLPFDQANTVSDGVGELSQGHHSGDFQGGIYGLATQTLSFVEGGLKILNFHVEGDLVGLLC